MTKKTLMASICTLALLLAVSVPVYAELSEKEFLDTFSQALSQKDRAKIILRLVETNPEVAKKVLLTLRKEAQGTDESAGEAKRKAAILSTVLDMVHTETLDLDQIHNEAKEAYNAGNYDKAIARWMKALELAIIKDDIRRMLLYRLGITQVYNRMGDIPNELRSYKDALGLCDRIGDVKTKADILQAMGLLYEGLGNSGEASKYYEQARAINPEISNRKK